MSPVRPIAAAMLALSLVGFAPAAALAQAAPTSPQEAMPSAAELAQAGPLLDALGLTEVLPIMRQEGLDAAESLASDMFPGRGGPRWQELVGRIYREDRMREVMTTELARALEPGEIDAVMQFFASDLGRRIVRLEVSAREALLDESVEEASQMALERMRDEEDPRLGLLERFIDVNDLVEMNVVGALNSNWAFYRGLDAGGAFGGTLTEDEMLRDVWRQEGEIREETEDWVFGYLGMAYRPLSDDEVSAYIALSETPEGQALNTALFAAYDALFTTISRDLGLAAAQFMAGEDI